MVADEELTAAEIVGEDAATIGALHGLLDLARSAGEAPLQRVLESAATAIARSAGFETVLMNVFRPASNDFHTEHVHGPSGIAEVAADPPLPRDILSCLPGVPAEPAPGVFFLAGEPGMWDGHPNFHYTPRPERDEPNAWRPEDVLLVLLEDTDGEPLGLVSVDDPHSGMRPSDRELQRLRLICLYVEQALRTARRARRTEEDTRMLARLSEISPQLSECGDRRELHRLVIATITSDLGFERAAIYAAGGCDELRRMEVGGWESLELLPERLAAATVRVRLASDRDQAGTWLIEAADLFGPSPEPRSRRNGSGPLAWNDHCLLVPWFDDRGGLAGLVVAEDPTDRLLPRKERRYALQLLVDLAASIENTIAQRVRLNRLASLDTLTGLRNRRGLHRLIGQADKCVVMICDLDQFKQINDRYGHEAGDLVLARFAEILREHTREGDVAVRLGGDEFCLVLRDADEHGAGVVAERIRLATPKRMLGLVPSTVTVSVGLAWRDAGRPGPRALLTGADRALYGAKQSGRNRTVAATRVAG
ncbi:MAG TPA: GGDEF domain-containing protein [Solirubrobacteraceae bacterium]|nr:GGDEF domain-containing protein [Solirubrobacteraceae bacterium]